VLSYVKKIFQHTHSKGFSKTTRAGDQGHLRWSSLKKLRDQSGLIHIIISVAANIRKIRDSNRNIYFSHEMAPFLSFLTIYSFHIILYEKNIYNKRKPFCHISVSFLQTIVILRSQLVHNLPVE